MRPPVTGIGSKPGSRTGSMQKWPSTSHRFTNIALRCNYQPPASAMFVARLATNMAEAGGWELCLTAMFVILLYGEGHFMENGLRYHVGS
jgi:hypothetical protein